LVARGATGEGSARVKTVPSGCCDVAATGRTLTPQALP